MAGYPGTPLAKKLGLKAGMTAVCLNAPTHYDDLLAPLPEPITWHTQLIAAADFIHFFTKSQQELTQHFPLLKAALAKDGLLWISWPKKAAKVATDVNENIVREIGLANGLVDVKVAAVDEVWSGLKFVYRLVDRG
jgi:hypothetical protein